MLLNGPLTTTGKNSVRFNQTPNSMNDFINKLNNSNLPKNHHQAKTNAAVKKCNIQSGYNLLAVEKTFNNAEDLFDD